MGGVEEVFGPMGRELFDSLWEFELGWSLEGEERMFQEILKCCC